MKHILFDATCNRKNDQNNAAFPPIVRFPPPSPEQMVQSWFIHKILAEHKRRGLHSSHSVTRWIPGEDTRTLPFSGRPESYLSLAGLVFFFFFFHPCGILAHIVTPDMDSVSPACRTDSPPGTLFQKTPEEASSPASSSEITGKVWMVWLVS